MKKLPLQNRTLALRAVIIPCWRSSSMLACDQVRSLCSDRGNGCSCGVERSHDGAFRHRLIEEVYSAWWMHFA